MPKPNTTQPNIILIIVDDLGYQDLACYGGTAIETPNLDQLAKEGIRFRQAYSGCPVCAPSRSVLMTGTMLDTRLSEVIAVGFRYSRMMLRRRRC